MAEPTNVGKKKKKIVKKVDPAREELNRMAAAFISESTEDQLREDLPSPARQVACGIIDNRYHLATFRERVQGTASDRALIGKVYRFLADEMVQQLREETENRRVAMRRNMAHAAIQARQEAQKEAKKKKRRKPKVQEEGPAEGGEGVVVEKQTLEEIGREMLQREETDAEEQKKREEEEEQLKADQNRFDAGYQTAFELYGEYVRYVAGPDDKVDHLIKQVVRLGSSTLTDRQLAIDQILNEANLKMALPALLAGVRDRVIAQKVIMSLGRIDDPKLISVLLGLCKEYASAKEANMRGTGFQAIGNIVQALDRNKKGAGSIRLYQLISRESYEKDLRVIIGLLTRDIASQQMRKYYYDQRCLKWLQLIGNKLMKEKQKAVNVPLVKLKMHTPISKTIREALKTIESYAGA